MWKTFEVSTEGLKIGDRVELHWRHFGKHIINGNADVVEITDYSDDEIIIGFELDYDGVYRFPVSKEEMFFGYRLEDDFEHAEKK